MFLPPPTLLPAHCLFLLTCIAIFLAQLPNVVFSLFIAFHLADTLSNKFVDRKSCTCQQEQQDREIVLDKQKEELVGGLSQSTSPGASCYRNLRSTCNHCCFEAKRSTTRLLNYGCVIPLLECLFHVFLATVEYYSVWFMSCTCMYMSHAHCIQQSITIILIC